MHQYLAKILEINTQNVDGDEDDQSPPPNKLTNQQSTTSVSSRAKGRGGKGAAGSSSNLDGNEYLNNISDSQMKKQIAQKLIGAGGKRGKGRFGRGGDPFNGKTEEELREEQRRLFENAQNYVSDESDEGGSVGAEAN